MSGNINRRLDELQKLLSDETLAKEGFTVFRNKTPIRSGNAKRKTFLNRTTIEADYPYARRLDEGYSKQAPRGMTEPTIKHMQDYIKKQSKG